MYWLDWGWIVQDGFICLWPQVKWLEILSLFPCGLWFFQELNLCFCMCWYWCSAAREETLWVSEHIMFVNIPLTKSLIGWYLRPDLGEKIHFILDRKTCKVIYKGAWIRSVLWPTCNLPPGVMVRMLALGSYDTYAQHGF